MTVYRLSTDPLCRALLVEQGGIRSVISLLHRHHHVLSQDSDVGTTTSTELSSTTRSLDCEPPVREKEVVVPGANGDAFSVLLSRESMFTAQLEQEAGRGMGMGLGSGLYL